MRPQPRAGLGALEGYHSAQADVPVRLNANESPYPPPAAFVTAWLEELADIPYHRYPDRHASQLRLALATHLQQPDGRLFVANGSNEVLQTLLLTYGGHGRSALVFEPTYALHSHIAQITDTRVIEGPRDNHFAIDLDAAATLIDQHQPEIVFACSPNNPTGTLEPQTTIETLLELVSGYGGLLIVDEAYGEFADWSALELIDDDTALVVVRTYSKVWSLAALRLGYAIGPTWLVETLEQVVLPYHLSTPTQAAGQIALTYSAEMEARVTALTQERSRIFAALSTIPDITVYPSGANFLLFRIHGDGQAIWQALLAQGVLVRDFSHWPKLNECLRVTIGTPDENNTFLDALRHSLEETL